MNGTPVASGMGTCGFVGQIGVYTGWVNYEYIPTIFDWIGLLSISFILPAIITYIISIIFRSNGWIKENDLKLD